MSDHEQGDNMTRQTKGEFRVGISFNPSADDTVSKIKRAAADLIDLIDSITSDRDSSVGNERGRLKALAQTRVEEAAMWAVKAATKGRRSMATEMKLVPVEPTGEMLRAAQAAWLNDPARRPTTMWQAMLAAAPVAEAGEGERLRARVAAAYESAAPVAEAGEAERLRDALSNALGEWVLVPKKPTLEMSRAVLEETRFCNPVGIYQKMLAAAPAPAAEAGKVERLRAVPEPMREAPADGVGYWVPLVRVDGEASTFFHVWRSDDFDRAFLVGGLCHSTEAAARAHAEAMIAMTKLEDV